MYKDLSDQSRIDDDPTYLRVREVLFDHPANVLSVTQIESSIHLYIIFHAQYQLRKSKTLQSILDRGASRKENLV